MQPFLQEQSNTSSGRRGRLIGSLGYILVGFWPRHPSQRRENGRGMPGDRFSGPGDHSGPISSHFRRFRARPPICDLNTVTLPQLRLLRHQHCVLRQDRCLFLQQKTSVLSQQQTSVLSQQQASVLSQQKTSILSQQKIGQFRAVAGRRPAAVLSSVETG